MIVNLLETSKAHKMEIISEQFFKAIAYLLISGAIYLVYSIARDSAKSGKFKKTLWQGLLACAGIALFASISLGDPTCLEQADPMYGGCSEYADDSFEPTTTQKVAHFVFYFPVLYIPVVRGAYLGKDEKAVHNT